MKTHSSLKLLLLSGICLAAATGVNAQATRTWVSGVGDDVDPCSRTAPCKTFAGAFSKTAAGGEINCINAGGFGAVTITKAITIDGGGVHASILSSLTNGVVVNAASTDVVVLRNLSINGAGKGINGINILKAKNVLVENCQISGVTNVGINVVPGTAGASVIVHVNNTYLRKCTVGGIFAKPSVAGIVAFVHLEDVHANANTGSVYARNWAEASRHPTALRRATAVTDSPPLTPLAQPVPASFSKAAFRAATVAMACTQTARIPSCAWRAA